MNCRNINFYTHRHRHKAKYFTLRKVVEQRFAGCAACNFQTKTSPDVQTNLKTIIDLITFRRCRVLMIWQNLSLTSHRAWVKEMDQQVQILRSRQWTTLPIQLAQRRLRQQLSTARSALLQRLTSCRAQRPPAPPSLRPSSAPFTSFLLSSVFSSATDASKP